MFCKEPIINVFMGDVEWLDSKGSNCWLDFVHELAFHTTAGKRIILETESYMISLGVDGAKLESKQDFKLYDQETLDETFYIFEDETENGIEEVVIVESDWTLFVGEFLESVESCGGYFMLKFSDFEMKLIPYELNGSVPSLRNKDHFSYNHVLGFDRHLKAKCPHCGGEGEILMDFTADFVVRCKNCKKSALDEMQIRLAIENWNNGEVYYNLAGVKIE